MFGLYNIAPDATPEQIRRNRAIIEQMMPRGNARYVGEGMVDLASGVIGGLAGRRMNRAEDMNVSREQKRERLDAMPPDLLQEAIRRAGARPARGGAQGGDGMDALAGGNGDDMLNGPVLGVDFQPYSQLGGATGRVGAPWATGGQDVYGDDPYGARRYMGVPEPTQQMQPSPGMQTAPQPAPGVPVAPVSPPPMPSSGEVRGMSMPADPAMMGEEMDRMRFERQPADGKRVMRQDEAFSLPGFNTTEGQVLGYTMRAAEANRVLNQMEQQGTRWGQRALGILPGNSENMLRDDDFQQYLNAEQNFLAAVLRRDTGAAITSQEFDLYRPMFFPQPGDGQQVIEQKRRMRESALAAMAAGTAEGFNMLPEDVQGLLRPGQSEPAAPLTQPAGQPQPTHRFNPATGQIEAIQ